MELFCAAIRRDSVFLLKFPFLSPDSGEILSVRHLKSLNICFSPHFCFLVVVQLIFMLSVLFLVIVISLFLLFFM